MTTALHGYSSELVDDMTPSGSRRLRIRPLHPDEDVTVSGARCPPEPADAVSQVLSPMPALPDSLVQLLASMDDRRGLSLVAEVDTGDRREVIGLGSLERSTTARLKSDSSSATNGNAWRRDYSRDRVMRLPRIACFERFVVHVLSEKRPDPATAQASLRSDRNHHPRRGCQRSRSFDVRGRNPGRR